jgi:hypothetical protein
MVQKASNIVGIIPPNLNPDGGVGRTQKQKALKQFVIVSARLKPLVFQIRCEHLTVACVLEYRNVGPGLCFPQRGHNSIIPASTEPLCTRLLVFIDVLHKLLTDSIVQTTRGRDLFPDTRAICGTNFREAQVAHLVRLFHLKDFRYARASQSFPEVGKNFGNKIASGAVFLIDGTD